MILKARSELPICHKPHRHLRPNRWIA